MIGHGVSSRSSHSAAAGRTTCSAKPCTQSRMSRWSCESSSENGAAVAASMPRILPVPPPRRARSEVRLLELERLRGVRLVLILERPEAERLLGIDLVDGRNPRRVALLRGPVLVVARQAVEAHRPELLGRLHEPVPRQVAE